MAMFTNKTVYIAKQRKYISLDENGKCYYLLCKNKYNELYYSRSDIAFRNPDTLEFANWRMAEHFLKQNSQKYTNGEQGIIVETYDFIIDIEESDKLFKSIVLFEKNKIHYGKIEDRMREFLFAGGNPTNKQFINMLMIRQFLNFNNIVYYFNNEVIEFLEGGAKKKKKLDWESFYELIHRKYSLY